MKRLGVLAALCALAPGTGCESAGGETPASRSAADYTPLPGTRLYFADPIEPGVVRHLLLAGEADWQLRTGTDWDTATDTHTFVLEQESPLVVDGTEWLPESPAASEEVIVYYGIFPDSVLTTAPAGDAAGEWAFARDLGPIRLAWAGSSYELVYYERDVVADTGG